jgi:hypothetical protein
MERKKSKDLHASYDKTIFSHQLMRKSSASHYPAGRLVFVIENIMY